MPARDDLIAIPDELLRNGNIGQAALVFMDFLNSPQRWWTGFGDLDVGGHRWRGLGDLISMSSIQTNYQVSAKKMSFEVAATQEMLALALNAKARVRDRAVTVYLQMFAMDDVEVAGSNILSGQPIGSPIALFNGTMQKMPWSADGPNQRKITIEAEGLFFRRNSPPRGRWTDADQKARYPGDRGLERLPLYSSAYEARWRT